jgi:hypothetical protein
VGRGGIWWGLADEGRHARPDVPELAAGYVYLQVCGVGGEGGAQCVWVGRGGIWWGLADEADGARPDVPELAAGYVYLQVCIPMCTCRCVGWGGAGSVCVCVCGWVWVGGGVFGGVWRMRQTGPGLMCLNWRLATCTCRCV